MEEWREKFNKASEIGKQILHISWIPFILYIGTFHYIFL